MYQGKHISAKRNAPSKRARRFRKEFVVLCSIAVLLCGMIGGTLAYLFATTSEVKNSFVPAEVPPSVTEDFNPKGSKKDVQFTNNGNVNAYIRANVIIYWEDEAGNVVTNPAGHDYYIDCVPTNGWVEYNGYYYYTKPVAPKAVTPVLIKEAYPTAGTEYKLVVDVLCESIQAEPAKAVGDAWGVVIAPNSVTPYSGN